MSFKHLETIYRDYDIRGKFPEEIAPEEVKLIAKAVAKKFSVKKVAIGRDIRPSADELFNALAAGFIESGVSVIDLGLTTTPMVYHFCGTTEVDAAVMITASHMPSEYNGLKISIEDSKPLTADLLQEIRDIVRTHTFSEETTHGSIINHSMQADWIEYFKEKHDFSGANLKVVIDPANMIGILEIDTFKAFAPSLTVHTIFDDFDHTCPNHEANPLKPETLQSLSAEVRCRKADLGIAFDGDADRVGFVDETGKTVPADLIGALLVRYVLQEYPNSHVVFDIRSSRSLAEEIIKYNGLPVPCRVGHTHVRTKMRECDAVLGVELAGHFFFKESFFSEGGPLPAFMIMELMGRENKTLSQLVCEVQKYYHSGEINSEVSKTPEKIYADLEQQFSDGKYDKTDGLKITYRDWWFNIRPSANDPVMRLNLEANTKELMEEKRDQILKIIRS